LESTDQRLLAVLLQLTVAPSAAAHRQVAREYQRLDVLDLAQEHYSLAVHLDPTDATSFDAMARIWRDWGTPQLGLGDAYRAVYQAPGSPEAANTLGTVLQALGEVSEAKRAYARALSLDPNAWYALNNICYVDILTRQMVARESCHRAVAAGGSLAKTPRNNLALAYAAAGDFGSARRWFRLAGEPAVANYNYGILLMATHSYEEAATAFQAALTENPDSTLAAARVRQARQAAAAGIP
ncbi:MAG: tetratricopeptide repeat protein, partial [Vicinamibacterales bacterium]